VYGLVNPLIKQSHSGGGLYSVFPITCSFTKDDSEAKVSDKRHRLLQSGKKVNKRQKDTGIGTEGRAILFPLSSLVLCTGSNLEK
jgi:hypothetical protein